jgi:hypothetical protein
MSHLKIVTRVAADGTVSVTLPAGTAIPGEEVLVTIGPPGPPSRVNLPPDEWARAFRATEGNITDPSFRRPEQPLLEPAPEFD